ncbi:type II toxin-antitoxin system VapC family toxin [Vandammella animalimorsus]|uniref:VapC toxin family PIN domain ribonuclease n=1 Tax=Vandammella animalimorsus TaxID=2029117 RepID=A0A2A2AXM3_9BURK|nr:type II toxin-antitoxin system VapC family toxin [Vandammella animalimorsus]PAT42399.1 VapC toxin family PIN domain ribonuclease [Vandammella animalimorsus]
MKITADTNILLRAVLQDEPRQAAAASELLRSASLVAVPLPSLCELVWILRRGAKLSKEEIAQTLRDLMDTKKVAMNRPAVEAGLAVLEAGGDFADGAIAHEGSWLGAEIYCSFDKQAVRLLEKQGKKVKLITG